MPQRIRCLIVDDEPLARKGIRTLLKAHPDVEITGESTNGIQAVEAITTKTIDVVFLDVQMPGLDGFGVIERVGAEKMPFVIFVTAYDLHALHAFEVHAVDYLLKPIDPGRFSVALDRARAMIQHHSIADVGKKLLDLMVTLRPASTYQERFVISSVGRVNVVPVDDIEWIQAEGDYVRIHARGKSHLHREKIGTVEELLEPSKFIRVHRSAIVRIDRISALKPLSNGDYRISLSDGTQIGLSRTYREKVLSALRSTAI